MSPATPTHKGLLRSSMVVGLSIALSRVLGLVRQILMATCFGTSLVQSAFVVAFRIPNLFRALFGEGALSAAFVPVFAEALEKEGAESSNRLAGRVMSMLGVVLAAIVFGGILLASAGVEFLTLNEKWDTVLRLLRIMLPYMFFICLAAVCMGVLNSYGHFLVPALAPVLLNVVWIGTLLFICPRFGNTAQERIYGVAWGILAAGSIQLLAQIPALRRLRFRPPWALDWRDAAVRRILLLMGPAVIGTGAHQINTMIDGVLAMWVDKWAPAALSFAEFIVYLPLGMFATSMGTVLLPTLSRQAARDANEEMKTTLRYALEKQMLIMAPAATGLVVLAVPVTQLIYEWSGWAFDSLSTLQTARALMFYAPGLVAFGTYKMFVPAFYALKDTRTPMRVALVAVGLNLCLNLLFIATWPHDFKHAGLAFSTVLASVFNGAALGWILHRRIGSLGWRSLAGHTAKVLVFSLIMGAAVLVAHRYLSGLAVLGRFDPKLGQALVMAASVMTGIVVYGVPVGLMALRAKRVS